MKIKWKAVNGWGPKIEATEIAGETESMVVLGMGSLGRRARKITDYDSYHDTWEEAQAHLLAKAEQRLAAARRVLAHEQDVYGNIKGMKKP